MPRKARLKTRRHCRSKATGDVRDHTFSIEFLDPGVEAYSFTFG
ncbi:hypothetical protein [Paraburkholderia sp.]